MPPIDPLQLLKALAPLLSSNGGMKSAEEVVRLSSLMKKFSRKLVSRCVYVNVLTATSVDILEAFLSEGGWATIHMWLQESKKSDNYPFIVELLQLFKSLPMTVDRLKENNSAKLVKSLTKSENEDVRLLASQIVEDWMKLVKGESTNASNSIGVKDIKTAKRKKKRDYQLTDLKNGSGLGKDLKELKKNVDNKKSSDHKKVADKDTKNQRLPKEAVELEDVKLPEYLEKEILKKPKRDRPKTVKTFHTKFRSTGLEEIALPVKPTSKKPSVDKTAVLAAKNAVKRISVPVSRDSHPLEKKLKSSNLSPEGTEKLGIKLIPPKPKPVHIIKESAGFMDALVGEPAVPTKKKKKSARSPTATTPPIPLTNAVTPKLQFYKDTLETNDSKGEENEESNECSNAATQSQDAQSQDVSSQDGDTRTETDMETGGDADSNTKSDDVKSSDSESTVTLKKQSKKKKNVSWAEETQLRQIYYFELDETERVNVNNIKNFGDMKTLDRMKERQAVETARRMNMGDKMEERIMWLAPILIDLPQALVERGCNSIQKEIQQSREQSILQEIYFSKDSVPDTPHEPDPEVVEPEELKIIPLEDENNPDSVVDHSMVEIQPPLPSLPSALSNLVLSLNTKPPTNNQYEEMPFREDMNDPYFKPNPGMMPGALGPPFVPFGKFPPPDGLPPGAMMPPDDGVDFRGYYENVVGMPGMPPPPPHGSRMRMPGPIRGWGAMGPIRGRGMSPQRGMPRGRGGPPPHMRGRGGRPLCRHFANGTCKYEESCMFLHPGVNGPLI